MPLSRIVHRSCTGFSLLDLLIAVIIVSILAAISVPSYQDSILTSRRAAAKSELLRLAQAEARWRVNHITYADLNSLGGAAANADYTFSATVSGTAFTLTATPTSTHQQDDDACGSLSITELNMISSSSLEHCPNP